MPRKDTYRSLLLLMRIYSTLLDAFIKEEIGFLYLLIRFHILLFEKKRRAALQSVKDTVPPLIST